MASVGDIKINMRVSGYACSFCGEWVTHGAMHWCSTMSVPPFGALYPQSSPLACNHCRCIDVPPSGERTKPHKKCCQCGDTRVAEE